MKKQLRLFLAIDGIYAVAFGLLGPIYAIYVQGIGGDILDAGIAWSIFMIISGLGIMVSGKIQNTSTKLSRILMYGYLIRAAAFAGYIFVSTTLHLFLVQAVLGFALIINAPATYSFYTKHVEKGKFASQWSAWESVWYIAQGCAAIIGAVIAKYLGFATLFGAMAILSLISALMALKLQDDE